MTIADAGEPNKANLFCLQIFQKRKRPEFSGRFLFNKNYKLIFTSEVSIYRGRSCHLQ
jgi:hypothetical protein